MASSARTVSAVTDNSAGVLSKKDEFRRNVREGAAATLTRRAFLPRQHVDILRNYQAIAWQLVVSCPTVAN